MKSFSSYLYEQYEKRKSRNPQYSRRAFARDLGVSSGRLADYLSGESLPNSQTLEKLFQALNVSPSDQDAIFEKLKKQKYLSRGQGFTKQLSEEEFRQVSNWKCWSLLTLFRSFDFSPETEWLSKKTGLPESEILTHLKNLETIGLIKKTADGYILTDKSITTSNDVPSSAIREAHRQFLNRAQSALENVPIEQRDMTSITMCIAPKNVSRAKEIIAEFRVRLSELLEHEQPTEVYNLNVCLFPVFHGGSDEKN
ncbi:TIGR02147 family protein [Bdellovibrio bacteriovorus]|uniref:TIGR02147 family protein n=1 Tax=Bdellovibrio bacteriovorus TaxID=959 RepID=UPI0035A72465